MLVAGASRVHLETFLFYTCIFILVPVLNMKMFFFCILNTMACVTSGLAHANVFNHGQIKSRLMYTAGYCRKMCVFIYRGEISFFNIINEACVCAKGNTQPRHDCFTSNHKSRPTICFLRPLWRPLLPTVTSALVADENHATTMKRSQLTGPSPNLFRC